MFEETALRVELHRAGQLSALDIQDDRVLIGSGAHCDVRLGPDEAAVEQLLVEALGDDELYARVKAVEPGCLLNGAPFLEGRLWPTSTLELPGLLIRVQRVERQAEARTTKPRTSRTSPALQALGLLAVALGLFNVLRRSEQQVLGQTAVTPPPLTAGSELPCPRDDARSAAALAVQLLGEAETRRERWPFHPADGLSALPLFARAGACFSVAGLPARAQETRGAEAELRALVADELHLRHVRLERLLSSSQYAQARRQAQILGELTADKQGPYAQWLSAIRREADLRDGKEKP